MNGPVLLILMAQTTLTAALSPPGFRYSVHQRPLLTRTSNSASHSSSTTRRFSSQWDDDDDEVTTKPSTFEEAGASLKKEEDDEKMNSMGDFDANPSVRVE
jgi:hypothetical protein